MHSEVATQILAAGDHIGCPVGGWTGDTGGFDRRVNHRLRSAWPDHGRKIEWRQQKVCTMFESLPMLRSSSQGPLLDVGQ